MPLEQTCASFLSWEGPRAPDKLQLTRDGERETEIPPPAEESRPREALLITTGHGSGQLGADVAWNFGRKTEN